MDMERVPPMPLEKTTSEIRLGDELISSFAKGAKSAQTEVVFSFDTTASMSPYLGEVRKKLKETCTKLMADIPGIKIGLIAHGDYASTNYVIQYQDLCSDTNKLVQWVEGVAATENWDTPECYELVLREARKLNWTKGDTVNRALVVIGDAPPHPPSHTTEKIYWRDEVASLVKEGVKIYGVMCSEKGNEAQPFYEEIAEMSDGVFLSLKHLPLITDMFKAVCYREFGVEHLETYRVEVTERGAMDQGMTDLFTQLKEGAKKGTQFGERSKQDWYLAEYDKDNRTKYTFAPSTKTQWKSYLGTKVTTTQTSPSAKRKTPEPMAKKEKKEAKKKEVKEKKEKKTPASPKTKKTPVSPKSKAKKQKKESESEEEEEEKKPLKKTASHIVGSGDWKRDRHGRMASLN